MNKLLAKYLPLIIFIIIILPLLGKIFLPLIAVAIIVFIIFTVFQKFKNYENSNYGNLRDKATININNIKKNNIKNMRNVSRTGWLILAVFLIIWLFFASIVIVDAGETGVYSLFGKVSDKELSSGFHLIIPFAKVNRMTIRTEEYTMSVISNEGKKEGADAITALTKEGLSVDLDMTVLYSLDEKFASDIYSKVGINYVEKIIRPAIRSTIREVIARYEAKDIYSDKRQEATQNILDNLKQSLGSRGIIIEEVLLRNVELPKRLSQSIQEKLQAEQEAEKYDFILAKEKKEKERKIIEAEGQRDSQKIITQSLTTNYLYYLYVSELKDRQGTIYVPTSTSTGMPLFRDLGK